MQTGVPIKSHLDRLILCFLSLFIFIHFSLSAPGLPGTERDESALANPFASGADRRLLQSYIQSTLKKEQVGPEMNTWEQEVFFLFRLFDFDRTGLLDGLEMMQLLTDYNSHHTPGTHANEQVISVVDFLLQTQDLNQDGLLAPSELLSAPLPQSQDASNDNAPQKEEEKDTSPDEEHQGVQDQKDESQDDMQPRSEGQEGQVQQEVTIGEEETHQEADEQQEHQLSQVPGTKVEQNQEVPVHQGQPEM